MIKTTDMRKQQTKNRGLTLIELLVTIMIMGIMIAVAVPVIRPPVDARSVKEAARMVSTALASARTKSIETGRSYGIQFVPLSSDGRQVQSLAFVQTPPPYTPASTIQFSSVTLGSAGEATLTLSGASDSTTQSKIQNPDADGTAQYGTLLRLNDQGAYYEVTNYDKDSSTITLKHSKDSPTVADFPFTGQAYTYQIFSGTRKSMLMPIQLPSRAVVDVKLSGIGDAGQFAPSATVPVRIMFTPTGDFVQIFHPGEPTGEDLDDNAYLFVGKAGRTTASADIEDNHLIDGEAIWISLSPRNGSVSSAENKPPAAGATDSQKENYTVNDARTWARE